MVDATLDTGLKEWEAVCRALVGGRQIMLLRKGGIHETAGVFEMERDRFLLFPTWLHQNIDWIKPGDRAGAETHASEPPTVTLGGWAQVSDIVRVKSRASVDALSAEHIYLPPLIDMRFDYRPDKPLYVLIVRAYRLATPITIPNTAAYAGCRSWVPLEQPIDIRDAQPALADDVFTERQAHIRRTLDRG